MEIGGLAQGNMYGVDVMDTIDFVFKHDIPEKQKITYAQFVCDRRP